MKHQARSLVVRLVISFAAITIVLYSQRAHLREALHVLQHHIIWPWYFVAVATYIAAHGILSLRIGYIFRAQGIRLSFPENFYLTFVGLFFNLFLPSAVGGDIAKAYYAYQHSGKKIEATTSIIWDRLMGFATLMGMAMMALAVFSKELNDPGINNFIYLFLAIFFAAGLLFSSKRIARPFKFLRSLIPSESIRTHLTELYHSLYNFKKHKKILVFTAILSAFGQTLFVLVHYWIARSLGADLNPSLFFVAVPLISIVTMVPSLGGLGVREAGVFYLFKRFMPDERALALSLLLDILIYGTSLVSGVVFAIKGGLKKQAIHNMEELGES